MRAFLLMVLSLVFIQCVHADDFAKLRIKISGAIHDNRYFLCTGSIGCVSIEAGDEGKVYPMSPGKVDYLYTTNVANLRLYPQALPASCAVPVKNNQTLTVHGRLKTGPNNQVYISDLNCTVS